MGVRRDRECVIGCIDSSYYTRVIQVIGVISAIGLRATILSGSG